LGFDLSLKGLSDTTRFVLRHELAHELRDQLVPGLGGRLDSDSWLLDGWAHFASSVSQRPDFFKPVCAGVKPPSLSELSIHWDLGQPGVDVSRLYATQQSMVEYLYERFGGPAYWDLLRVVGVEGAAHASFLKVLHVTVDQFYADWLTWAKKKYC
jgi:hypothetical protein